MLVPRADAAPDPHRVRTLAEAMIHSAVFRGLYVVPPTKENEPETPDEPSQEGPAPDLADGPPTVSDDGRLVTVRIRDGVRFGGDDGRDGQRARRRQGYRAGARRSRGRPGRAAAAGRGRRRPGPGRSREELDLRHRGDGRPHPRLPPTPTGGAARRRGPLDAAVDARPRRPGEHLAVDGTVRPHPGRPRRAGRPRAQPGLPPAARRLAPGATRSASASRSTTRPARRRGS